MGLTQWCMAGRLLVVAVFAAGCLGGCATLQAGAGDAGATRTVWTAREQFVKVVPRERGESPDVVNEHPAAISPAALRRLLASPRLSGEGEGGARPLFTDLELKVLEEALASGLRQAGPDEELTFAVFGYHPALMGLAREAKVTTGRIFLREGRLNLILGIVQREAKDHEDRRLHPFVAGSRLKPSTLAGGIVPAPDGVPFTLKRGDWLVFDPAASVPSDEPAPAAPATTPAPRPPEPQKKGERPARGIEERLRILIDLKEKQLITEEEYRAKRREILDGI